MRTTLMLLLCLAIVFSGARADAKTPATTQGQFPPDGVWYAAADECHRSLHPDPEDRESFDVVSYALLFDCKEEVWTIGVETSDEWESADLEYFFTFFDTDGDSTTGYQGYDYTLMVYPEGEQLQAGVFSSPTSEIEETWELTATAQVDRSGERTFFGVVFHSTGLDGAEQFRWTAELAGAEEPGADRLPNTGVHDTTITRPEPPPAVAEARSIEQACPPDTVPHGGLTDIVDTNAHARAIDCVLWWRISNGVSDDTYAPGLPVTRAQMASFLARVVTQSGGTLPASPPNAFPDDRGSVHEDNIDRLAAAGIVQGTGEGLYDPGTPVSRAQMATFLVRTYEYRATVSLPAAGDYFDDDDDVAAHVDNIDRAAAAGFTGGRPDGTYRPGQDVRRDQMASFLARMLDLLVDEDLVRPPAA